MRSIERTIGFQFRDTWVTLPDKAMISIVVPAYNEEKTIGTLLQSLMGLTVHEPWEVIVVDNASTDRTAIIAKSFADKLPLRILYEPRKGRGPARAAGFAATRGDFIFSTDADASVPPHWIGTLLAGFSDKTVTAVTGTCRIEDGSAGHNFFFNVIQPTAMVAYRLLWRHYWLTGSNFAIRRTAYAQAGGFAHTLNAMEDMELSRRVSQGGRIVFTGRAPVTVSGRRFRLGLWRGYVDYLSFFWRYLRHNKSSVVLGDRR